MRRKIHNKRRNQIKEEYVVDSSDLVSTFIKPFTDVVGVAAGEFKELARRGITLVQIAFESIMTSLVPFLGDSYEEIFQEQAQDISKIRSEYRQYTDSLRLSGDAKLLAFIAFPGYALTSKFASDAPDIAAGTLSLLTGGTSDKYTGYSPGSSGPRGSKIFDSYSRLNKSFLFEKRAESEAPTLSDKFQNKKLIYKLLSASPVANAAAREAREIHENTIRKAYAEAQSVLKAKSIPELEKLLGKKLEGREEFENIQKELQGEERRVAEKELFTLIKKSAKKVYIDRIKKEMQDVISTYGEDHPFVSDYNDLIAKISLL